MGGAASAYFVTKPPLFRAWASVGACLGLRTVVSSTGPRPGNMPALGVPEPHTGLGPCVSPQSIIFDEVDLTDASVAESSTKNVNNSFTVRLWTHTLRGSSPYLVFLLNLNMCVSSSDFFVLFALMEMIPGRF